MMFSWIFHVKSQLIQLSGAHIAGPPPAIGACGVRFAPKTRTAEDWHWRRLRSALEEPTHRPFLMHQWSIFQGKYYRKPLESIRKPLRVGLITSNPLVFGWIMLRPNFCSFMFMTQICWRYPLLVANPRSLVNVVQRCWKNLIFCLPIAMFVAQFPTLPLWLVNIVVLQTD